MKIGDEVPPLPGLKHLNHPLADFYRNRGLLWQFSIRTVELRHKGSHLGLAWSVVSPLLMLGLYVFVFGYIFAGRFGVIADEGPVDYGLGIFLGLALFNFVGELLGVAPLLVAENTNFVKKIVFPLEVLPASHVLAATIHLGITLILVLLGIIFFGRGLSWSALWLPVIIAPLVMWGLGIAWLLSALGVFIRDLRLLTPALGTIMMFSSAVFYSTEKIPAAAWSVLRFNPLLQAISAARDAVVWSIPVNPLAVLYLYISGFLAMIAGYTIFRKLKPAFADVI